MARARKNKPTIQMLPIFSGTAKINLFLEQELGFLNNVKAFLNIRNKRLGYRKVFVDSYANESIWIFLIEFEILLLYLVQDLSRTREHQPIYRHFSINTFGLQSSVILNRNVLRAFGLIIL